MQLCPNNGLCILAIFGSISPELRKVNVTGITTETCAAEYGDDVIVPEMLCVNTNYTTGAQGACNVSH